MVIYWAFCSRYWLVVELVEILHVPKDDVLLVDDPRRDLLHATGHFPQVRLHREQVMKKPSYLLCADKSYSIWSTHHRENLLYKFINNYNIFCMCMRCIYDTYIHTFPQVSDVGFLSLNQLSHYKSVSTQGESESQAVCGDKRVHWSIPTERILSSACVLWAIWANTVLLSYYAHVF